MDSPKVLLIGFGNTTRGDDGAGWEVARLLDLLCLPGLEIQVSQQLGIELLEEWGGYDRVVFVDAIPGGNEVRLERVQGTSPAPPSSTHHLTPEALLHLSGALYDKCPELYLCSIPAEQFALGDGLSSMTRCHIRYAVRLIRDWMKGAEHARA